MELLAIQSLGFFWDFKKISKSPGPMEQLTIQSLGFLIIGFQEDIKIPWHHETTNHTVIRVSYRISTRYQNHRRRRRRRRHHHHHQHRHHHHHHHHHHHPHPPHHHHHHRHLGLPGRSLRVQANLRVLPYL